MTLSRSPDTGDQAAVSAAQQSYSLSLPVNVNTLSLLGKNTRTDPDVYNSHSHIKYRYLNITGCSGSNIKTRGYGARLGLFCLAWPALEL